MYKTIQWKITDYAVHPDVESKCHIFEEGRTTLCGQSTTGQSQPIIDNKMPDLNVIDALMDEERERPVYARFWCIRCLRAYKKRLIGENI